MTKKSFILSSAGLKNLVQNQNYGDDFKFIFGEHEIQMKNLFAEFISPYVSQIHQSDPTITSIHFYNMNFTNQSKTNYLSKMSEEIFSLFEAISKGNSIDIDKEQCFQLQNISILLKNREMFTKLYELFEDDEKEEEFEKKIVKFWSTSFLDNNSDLAEMWNQSETIDYMASNLYSFDEDQIIDLPRTVFHSILTNDNLTIESEDWLLDLIDKFVSKETIKSEDGLSDSYFYEEVNFDFLSEDKKKEFIEKVDPNELTGPLWHKIKRCYFYKKKESPPQKTFKESNKREGNGFYRQNKKYARIIIVGGDDHYNQIGNHPNNRSRDKWPIISPPQKMLFDSSTFLSYSAYSAHSVVVGSSGTLMGIGYNDGRASSSLTTTNANQYTEFQMNDSNGKPLSPVSAVCTTCNTLYMFTKSGGKGRQLVLCDNGINAGTPVFLDIGKQEPVALFGGFTHAAAICTDGKIIFINRESVVNSSSSKIPAVSLPGDEKATMVACLRNSVLALSSTGRVYQSEINDIKFSLVSELSGFEIVWLSGSCEHCLAVSSEGRVFGCGSNNCGQLGFEIRRSEVPSFTQIFSLSGHKIRAAYAGCFHSLFETHEGKVLSCGYNFYGQLLLKHGINEEYVYTPTETTITSGATFCIAGEYMSAVFGNGDPPPNTPNTPVRY